MEHKGVLAVDASSRELWREWLVKNHSSTKSVWLVIYKKDSKIPSVTYSEAVDEALCFGWIDSLPNKRDSKSYFQYFSKRNPTSNWSKVNKKKVDTLIDAKLMTASGYEMVAIAKQTGTWDALNDVDNLGIPEDMLVIIEKDSVALSNWNLFPDSTKRGILEWIFNAKRKETRKKRIIETVTLAALNKRANQYRPKDTK